MKASIEWKASRKWIESFCLLSRENLHPAALLNAEKHWMVNRQSSSLDTCAAHPWSFSSLREHSGNEREKAELSSFSVSSLPRFRVAIELETLTVSVVNKTRLLLVSNPEQRPSEILIHIFFSVFLHTWSESREKRTLFVYRKKVS